VSTWDPWARDVLLRAWPSSLPAPSSAELLGVQAVGRHEGFYGFASKPPGWAGSNNWGAIQCGHGPPCDGTDCFEAGDHTATGAAYRTCFRIYKTAEAGAAGLIRELYRRPSVAEALRAGDLSAVALAMRQTGYHETAPAIYAAALERNAAAIREALGEAPPSVAAGQRSSGSKLLELVWAGLFVGMAVRHRTPANRARRRNSR
jgi:hypothetical protein